jgi:hypothetical protein
LKPTLPQRVECAHTNTLLVTRTRLYLGDHLPGHTPRRAVWAQILDDLLDAQIDGQARHRRRVSPVPIAPGAIEGAGSNWPTDARPPASRPVTRWID